MPPTNKTKRPTDALELESDEEPYEKKGRQMADAAKTQTQTTLQFGKQAAAPAAAPAAAADDSDDADDDDDDDLDMSFLGGGSSAKAQEKPEPKARGRFSDVHSDKPPQPKSTPAPKSVSKAKVHATPWPRTRRLVAAPALLMRAWDCPSPGVFRGTGACGLARHVLGWVPRQALCKDGCAGGTTKRHEEGDGRRGDEAVETDHRRRRELFGRRRQK